MKTTSIVNKCLTTIETSRGSRVDGKPMSVETQETLSMGRDIVCSVWKHIAAAAACAGCSAHGTLKSADIFLGVPFNIASYALFLLMMAQVTDMVPGTFVHTFGDLHIYNNHEQQVKLQLTRTPYALPTMRLDPHIQSILEFKPDSFILSGYRSHDAIKAPVAI